MKVLVTVASRHGATLGIAEALAASLREAGLEVDVLPAEEVANVREHDAVVLGSAVYAGRWVDDARKLVDRVVGDLAGRPVWIFSSGPLGDPPKPAEDPPEVASLMSRTGARGHRLLSGRVDRSELGFAEKAILAVVRAPEGDYRDWPDIAAWGREIAAELAREPVAAR
jgi:menaquinone-dependent protoporphyrinogen oxidase